MNKRSYQETTGSPKPEPWHALTAEEVLEHIASPERISWLSERLHLDDEQGTDLQQTQKLVKRWRTTRRIEKERQADLLSAFGVEGWTPSIFLMGVVGGDWFL